MSGSPGVGQKFKPFESTEYIGALSCRLDRLITEPSPGGLVILTLLLLLLTQGT